MDMNTKKCSCGGYIIADECNGTLIEFCTYCLNIVETEVEQEEYEIETPEQAEARNADAELRAEMAWEMEQERRYEAMREAEYENHEEPSDCFDTRVERNTRRS